MCIDFKYPLMRMFFDADSVPCVLVDDVIREYPYIDKLNINNKKNEAPREFETFTWYIFHKENSLKDQSAISVLDLNKFVTLYDNICKAENLKKLGHEADWSMVCTCSVCNVILLPYEEAYSDHDTGQILCTSHAKFDEGLNGYKKSV